MKRWQQRLSRALIGLGLGFYLALLCAATAQAKTVLRVAAAADLATCIEELNAGFSKATPGVEVKASIGSSGNFFAQIRNGAPFDVFLSADTFYPQGLAKAGLAEGSSLLVYAHGRLVLWSVDPKIDLDAGLSVLADPAVTRIAIANPDVAPYGRAAKAALERAGIWDAVRPKLVLGENVAQAVQFVATGNAKVGLVGGAQAQALSRMSRGKVRELPVDSYPLLEQGAIITAKGKANPAAAKYLDFLRSEQGRAILRKHGFGLPERRS